MKGTKDNHQMIQGIALDLITEAGGAEKLAAMTPEDLKPIRIHLSKRLKEKSGCHINTAKRNIKKAIEGTTDNWGGIREGGGKPARTSA